MVNLDERLSAAERLAGRCERLIDVGSNHGLLPVHMLQNGLCEKALLCDISADALSCAERLVRKCGLTEKCELRVGDGLNGIELGSTDAVTVCGMGARTIMHILSAPLPCPAVMQANVELPLLRRHIERIGMHIARETVVRAGGRYYVLLRAEPGTEAPLSPYELRVGRCLLRERPPLYAEYLKWQLGVTERAMRGTENGSDPEKYAQAQQDYLFVRRALEETEKWSLRM